MPSQLTWTEGGRRKAGEGWGTALLLSVVLHSSPHPVRLPHPSGAPFTVPRPASSASSLSLTPEESACPGSILLLPYHRLMCLPRYFMQLRPLWTLQPPQSVPAKEHSSLLLSDLLIHVAFPLSPPLPYTPLIPGPALCDKEQGC